jgi:hypothetical protein
MCDKFPIIPQGNMGTCWFNVMITACCYSQELRQIVDKSSITWNDNSFYKYMKTILRNAYNPDKKIQELFIKQKIEYLLYKYLDLFDKKLKKYLQHLYIYIFQHPNFIWGNSTYIINFIKNLNINCLDIILIDNKYVVDFNKNINLKVHLHKIKLKDYSYDFRHYIGDKKYEGNLILELNKKIKKPNISKIPNVIVIHNPVDKYYDFNNIKDELLKHASNDLDIHINKDYLEYKGHTYKLDCCILGNYNFIGGHYILGLTCHNHKYIYNSANINNNLCKLYKFNWDLNEHKPFSFNYDKCKLNYKIQENKEQCFSFNKGDRILIYVKVENEYLSISNKREMKDDFYNVEKVDKYHLERIAKNLQLSFKDKSKNSLIHKFNQYIHKSP